VTLATGTVGLGICGANGMLAGELARLLEGHPSLEVRSAVGRQGLAGMIAGLDTEAGPSAVVLALPHGESASVWARIRKHLGARAKELYVVDLAADFRLRDPARYEQAYGAPHPDPEQLPGFVYGLPEFGRDAIRSARRVAAPGCFATALQLAALPAARAGILDASRPWIFHGVTGSSGSGNAPKPGTHHPHRHGNMWAYALEGHRHEAELAQSLEGLGIEASLHFTPHSGPFARGIHLTASLPLAHVIGAHVVREHFEQAFEGAPFVEVMSEGVPDIRHVAGSNKAMLAVSVRGQVLTVLCTLDNLVKGGAGQALQCLNLMLGLPETLGLPRTGLGVC